MYFDTLMLGVSHVEELVLCLWWWRKIPYSSWIVNTIVVVARVIFIHGFSRCRGYWIWVFCCLFSCIYMFGWLCRATCSFVSTSMFGTSKYITCYPKWEEALEFTYKVIGEELVLGLLLVVHKIPYSSCMWTKQDVICVFPSYCCLSGATCVPAIVQYIITWLLLLST